MILLADNFQYKGRKPIDTRLVFDTLADMLATEESIIYDGILVYNKETEKYYSFKTNNTVDVNFGKWREFESGSGSIVQCGYAIIDANDITTWDQNIDIPETLITGVNGDVVNAVIVYVFDSNTIVGIGVVNSYNPVNKEFNINCHKIEKNTDIHSVEYKQDVDYQKGNLIVLNGKLYIALKDFTSDNTQTDLENSLAIDILSNNINSVYADTDTNCKEYKQNYYYRTTDLIRHKNVLYLVSIDFTSDGTAADIDDAFDLDLASGKIFPVFNNGNAKIFEYRQGIIYEKDSLVYLNKKIARVVNDFKSNISEATIEDAFDSDCASGALFLVSSDFSILEYRQGENYKKDTLVYLNDKIARVINDYVANNIFPTPEQSLEDDIKNGKISLINTDHVQIMNEYAQGNMYFKDHLVYFNDLITRVINDFISDNVEVDVKDSFDKDVTSGSLLILNKEAEPGIKPYKQNTFFTKDKLVFADGRIGRVLNDYISDNTGATIEESINIDIANGNLREMGENYKFKFYKTTQDIDKTIDTINVLPISSILFENGETIQNMRINEAVYGPLGTLSLIQEIDINNGTIKAKTVNSREMEFMPPAPNNYRYDITLGGSGYTVGEIIPTSLPDVNAEVSAVGTGGNITAVSTTNETIVNTNGAGALIEAELVLHAGNGKQWFEIPKAEEKTIMEEYKQNTYYEVDSLIYLNNIFARVLKNFTSNAILPTTAESFKYDLDNGNILRMTREDVSIPECLGSAKTDNAADLPVLAIKGNWVLIENCVNAAPNQAGIGLYNGTSWDVSPIPSGTFVFPEPSDNGKMYLRKRDAGVTDGIWEVLTSINGNDIEITIKTKSDLTDNTYVPKANEFIWDTHRKALVIGDGSSTLGNLKPFYENTVTQAHLLAALGFTPEDSSQKGQPNGYAPLDVNGIVPVGNLPASLTDTYSKAEIDQKDADTLNAATILVNNEAARAKGIENGLRTDLDVHIADTAIHVTQSEKDDWNGKVEFSDLTNYDNHLSDTVIHVTQADKDKWDGMNKAYYVTSVSALPATGNQIGNIGYVQVSAAGVSPVVCDQYLWDGTKWNKLDANQVSLTFTWGNLQGKPASSALTIDNAVTVAHSHTNKSVLDKIGQSAAGNFTYDGVEIGVKIIFLVNENLLPDIGEKNTLYVIYEDSRVRNYPSISVYRDGSYQILGRGTQDAAPVVGDMSILQNEYFSVVKGSTYIITVNPNQYFAFMPMEILREIEGAKDQSKVIVTVDDPSKFNYNEDLLDITTSSKLTISIKEKETDLDTVSDFYYSHVDINLDDYKDIDNIG